MSADASSLRARQAGPATTDTRQAGPAAVDSRRSWARTVAWVLAVGLILHRTFVLPLQGERTDDFSRVYEALSRFLGGEAVYTEYLGDATPHYLYSPGATVILSPIAAVSGDTEVARFWFVCINAVGVIAGLAWLWRRARLSFTGWLFPLALAGVFLTESVTNTLRFSNINGVLSALLAVVLVGVAGPPRGRGDGDGVARGRDRATGGGVARQALPGVVLGLLILVKPFFAVLLLLPLLRRRFLLLGAAVAVPVVANVVGYLLLPDADAYRTTLMPYLRIVRSYANASIAGLGAAHGWPAVLVVGLRVVVAVGVVVGMWTVTARLWHRSFAWACAMSTILLSGTFVVATLGQQYYSLFLIPAVFTLRAAPRLFGGVTGAAGLLLVLSHNAVGSVGPVPLTGEVMTCIGWTLVVAAPVVAAVRDRRRQPARGAARARGRADAEGAAADRADAAPAPAVPGRRPVAGRRPVREGSRPDSRSRGRHRAGRGPAGTTGDLGELGELGGRGGRADRGRPAVQG
ncbi:glycosyltransferase family 87 protein [Corynebacterium bovis]|uniref:glycosyltransferase family 87 protein n=1 Tax=Corynebacterium bovis TaxID=36808 RepID=UPI0031389F27